jgi:hypothetical protein
MDIHAAGRRAVLALVDDDVDEGRQRRLFEQPATGLNGREVASFVINQE